MAEGNNQENNKASGDVSWIQDILVTAIVALIGTATALGVYLKAGFGLVPSLTVGAGLFIWLLSAHFLITRMRLKKFIDYRLNELADDVSSLKKEAEITDVLAEGHNELLAGQNALERAVTLIAERVDDHDNRLKTVYKLAQSARQAGATPSKEQQAQFKEMQAELLLLSKQLSQLGADSHQRSKEQFELIRAELEVLEMVVRQMTARGDAQQVQFCQKALAVIEGMRQLPQYKSAMASFAAAADLSSLLPGGKRVGFEGKAGAFPALKDEALAGKEGRGSAATQAGASSGTASGALSPAGMAAALSSLNSGSGVIGAGEGASSAADKSAASAQTHAGDNLLAVINEAIEADRIELFMQPIVGLPGRELLFYEALARLRNDVGQLLLPEDYSATADKAGLTSIIDNQMILMAIRVVQKLIARGKGKQLFCHLSFASLRDADFFAEFMDFMEANPWLSEHLVFVLSQREIDGAGAYDFERLADIGKVGFGFALDGVERLDLDFKRLAEMKFKFIKIRAELLLGNAASAKAEIHPADLAPFLDRLGIKLIVSDITREAVVRQLKDYKAGLVQGGLFCEPKPVRSDVLEDQVESAA